MFLWRQEPRKTNVPGPPKVVTWPWGCFSARSPSRPVEASVQGTAGEAGLF